MLIFLTGTTGSGKSKVAHDFAIENNFKIISLDSMSVYKNLDILSDKPSKYMQEEVQYYGIDIVDPNTNFSVFDYLSYLSEMKLDLLSQEENFLAVGGTGLYFNAIVNRYNFKKIDTDYRDYLESLDLSDLQRIYIQNGFNEKNIDTNNKRRLIRALESNNEAQMKNTINFKLPKNDIGIFWDHPDYKEKIKNRTYNMVKRGLLEEVKNLDMPSRTIQQAIGYKEALEFNDEYILMDKLNRRTFKLVKKQRTWFKKINNLIYENTNSDNKIKFMMKEIADE